MCQPKGEKMLAEGWELSSGTPRCSVFLGY